MVWEIEGTDEFVAWYRALNESEIDAVTAVVEMLEEGGPNLGRPHVDTLENSQLANLKELRPPAEYLEELNAEGLLDNDD